MMVARSSRNQNRTDPERWMDQKRRASRAWAHTVKLLVAENQERFNELYAQQAALVGVTPLRRNPDWVKAELARLQRELDRIEGEPGE